MTINELKRRDFFKVMGKGAVSAAAISLPTLANATPTSPTKVPSDHQTADSPLDATEMANLI
ncbi:amidase, partial [Vibrio splendidus]